MSRLSLLGVFAATLTLAACGSSGSSTGNLSADATTTPLNPTTPANGYRTIQIPEWSDDDSYNYYIKLDGKTYHSGDTIDISHYPQGLTETALDSGLTIKNPTGDYQKAYDGKLYLYKQAYSVVAGNYIHNQYRSNNNNQPELIDAFSVAEIQGDATPFDALPGTGRYTYKGEAFSAGEKGTLTYTADFGRKLGSGRITGLATFGDITLNSAPITRIKDENFNGAGVSLDSSSAVSAKLGSGTYGLGFFGPQANELAGMAEFTRPGSSEFELEEQDLEIGFGGKR
ncbi:factor H binding family protein [Uruburuella testudinis]|uniref:Factor H binding family protein n=1 Tax=Uruburuella testudinis TaxID=1282863 RepID=A0ABY4DTD7_9NEIS|nr:factor H binding family protein [Uruburuella testudinis]UOO82148.1 factor H binding family protein [Uruburuella testudinis]